MATYRAQNPPEFAGSEQEAVNRVLTGTALAAHSTGDEVLVYPVPVPPPPPDGPTTEMGVLQWPVSETDTDMPLVSAPTTVVVGSVFLIDGEYMTVTDVSNIDNPGVARGAYGSAVAAHAGGAGVSIWGTVTKSAQGVRSNATVAKQHAAEPREETKKEAAKRERDEEREEEDAEDRADAKHKATKKK